MNLDSTDESAPDAAKNPFARGGVAVEPVPAPAANEPKPPRDRTRLWRRVDLAVALFAFAAVAAGACWYVQQTVNDALSKIENTQQGLANYGRAAMLGSSNFFLKAQLEANRATFMAGQAQKDREWFTAMKVEAVNALTNAALDLHRKLGRQLNELAQTNLLRFDQNYAGRLKEFSEEVAGQRANFQKQLADELRQLNALLSKYDPLLKIDPDVAERIETALRQLKQLVEITELLKAREEADIKSLQNELTILTEKLKVLDLRLNAVTPPATNPTTPQPKPTAPQPQPPAPKPPG